MSNNENTEHQNDIVETYKTIVETKGEQPFVSDFMEYDISRDKIRRHFGGMEKLHNYMKENHSKFLEKHFSSVENIFSKRKSAHKFEKKRLVVTTAVADSEAHLGFLAALDNYCKRNDAQVVVMPCESVTNSFENKTATFDRIFNDPKYLFVQNDTPVNDNISLCSIQVSAKQIKPITGLSRIGNREGSYVFASPKQFLEYYPTGNIRGKNYSIMTPGACTLPKYFSEMYVSKRLSYIAEHDHTMGAIIVEIEDDKIFHFRQIQCDEKGDFTDFGVKYTSEGDAIDLPVNVVLGDIHAANVDREAFRGFMNEFEKLNVDRVFIHDLFDGYSISHHITDISETQTRTMEGKNFLDEELIDTWKILEEIEEDLNPVDMVIVKSNHDEFLTRYLQSGRYVNDSDNHYMALKIAPALFEEEDVLKRAFEVAGLGISPRWKFLDRESSYKVGDVECGVHGDLGLNGAKSSLNSLEKVYGKCITAHSHSAAIQRGVFRVGTLTKLDLGYNRGPSSWTHTCALVYENGQRQLINLIDGKCRLSDVS